MKTILSIQSAVTAGFVGNSVAGPVLTALDHHPMMIDAVQKMLDSLGVPPEMIAFDSFG